MRRFQIGLGLLLGVLFAQSLHATHIVGGEMNYTCLGNNEYEISLTIFRDCFNGNPDAWFDDPASIGIFDENNILLQQILIPLMGNDTLDPVLSDPCLVVPPDVCVHTTTYTATIVLPPLIGGYQLAYQRCCRNQTIKNIIDPLGSGATYGVTISERALLECNSNPKFNDWPPIYICVNEPINFDQSAVDIDGDSIVYRLCTPLLGATPDIPRPQPPNPPPYEPINWINPPYDVDNMLNGTGDGQFLEINAQTGLLTGVPNTIGQFVVGICVEEYRDGDLISTTRRDFQYNVGVCGQSVASFFAPEIQCESLTVDFDNMSSGAENYLWFFNDPGNPGFVSGLESPSYTYSDTGRFTVMLIAEPNSSCADTSFREVYLQYNSLFPDFSYEFEQCSDSLTIAVTDLTIDTISNPSEWSWELQPLGITSMEQNPTFTVFNSGDLILSLTVLADNGCEKVIEQSFPVELIEEELPADSVRICFGNTYALNPDFNPDYTYSWAPADQLSNPSSPNPTAVPDSTTTYSVTITDASGFCEIERSITVVVPEILVASAPSDTTICTPTYELEATSNTGQSFFWATDVLFSNVIATEAIVSVEPIGVQTYYLVVFDEANCEVRDSVTITGNGINVDLNPNELICEGDQVTLSLLNEDLNDTLTIFWEPSEFVFSGQGTSNPIVQPNSAGNFTFYANLENQLGCTLVDSTIVTVIDTSVEVDFLTALQCSGNTMNFTGLGTNAPFYVWDFGDPTNPGATATGETVTYTYPDTGTYTVMITLSSLVPCPDTLMADIQVQEAAISPAFSWNFESCSDTAVIQFMDESSNTQSTIIDWIWTIEDTTLNEQNPSYVIEGSQILDGSLQIISDDGCVDNIPFQIPINLVEEEFTDSIIICNGLPTALNPEANLEYSYTWTPAEGLDDPNSPNPLANPTQTTTYTVLVEDTNTLCAIEATVTAIVPPPLTLEIPGDTAICEPSFLLFANSPEAVSYAWSENSDFSTIFSEDPEVFVNPEQSVTYYVRVTDDFGCVKEETLTVDSNPVLVDLQGDATVCLGDTAEIIVVNQVGGELEYSWSPEENIISGQGTSNIIVNPNINTEYAVNINNAFGCSLDTSIQIAIFNFIPPLEIVADPDTLRGDGFSQLAATLDDNYTYIWEPSPSLSATDIANPTANPTETTTYFLRIIDQSGCTNEANITITVFNPECEEPFIFIPKGFTPNDDGKNDVFFVRGNNIDEMDLIIYNRWGEEVFRSQSPDIGWDGRYKGRMSDPDVFGYYVELRCFNGQTFTKKGNVTLIR